ncbi:MAG: general secretion pathway protein GspB [Pseudomonadota bacterium]|nr:general secretion pathway protein GspB [Pseudomonadota bacterium]
MSFILDALKKSEIERQRQNIPGLVESRAARGHAKLPGWAIALCLLLAVNLLVLLIVLTHSWLKPAPAVAVRSAPERAVAGEGLRSTAPAASFSPLDTPPVYAPEIAVPAGPPTSAPPMLKPAPVAGAGARPARRQEPVAQDYHAGDDEVLPTINEIDLTGALALPELHLDVHVFATTPAERFVYINMRKYHEGARLEEGPVIERIRRDGVVLTYHTLRFLLPRQ